MNDILLTDILSSDIVFKGYLTNQHFEQVDGAREIFQMMHGAIDHSDVLEPQAE
jgi:hypothetical protein